ncbi:MAG: RyR domain-containing protein [Armatimonadota bacterium]
MKHVLVTGDFVIDHHYYWGGHSFPTSSPHNGMLAIEQLGGAGLLISLLISVSHQSKVANIKPDREEDFTVCSGLDEDSIISLPQSLHSYALWKPCTSGTGNKERVWRVSDALGYGSVVDAPTAIQGLRRCPKSACHILVLDDAGAGFRFTHAKELWPPVLHEPTVDIEWVVMKMSSPLAQGDLWRQVSSTLADRLILLVSINDVRAEEARVTRGISWESSALDLVSELTTNPNIRPLLRCRHLIVNFESAGALLVENANIPKERRFRLIFDAAHMEGEWGTHLEGSIFGYQSCLTAGVVTHLIAGSHATALETGVKAGLSTMRQLLLSGHGVESTPTPGYQFDVLAQSLLSPAKDYAAVTVPSPEGQILDTSVSWRIIADNRNGDPLPLFGTALLVAQFGVKALTGTPFARFGKLFTIDRQEIESLRNIRQLISDYKNERKADRPLSIAAFGPPGSGKSFSIKQIGREVMGDEAPILEFNLSQFSGPADLISAFHQVHDQMIAGITPIVFWDEFDARDFYWLQYLLAPMQDGLFREGQVTHPIGKCIFVFAGGTCNSYEDFGPRNDETGKPFPKEVRNFTLKKGPDFKSRLSFYLNVLGPNKRQVDSLPLHARQNILTDICFPIRRALLLRNALGLKSDEILDMDQGVLSALLRVHCYTHGARSLEKVVLQLKARHGGAQGIRRSDLPPAEVMNLHVDNTEFMRIVNREMRVRADLEDALAPLIHEYFRNLCLENHWPIKYDMDFGLLPPEIKEDNRAAAARMSRVLALAGLDVVPSTEDIPETTDRVRTIIKDHLEILAEAEHNGWMAQRLKNGWSYGTPRDDDKKINDALLPYSQLEPYQQEKDRNSVLHYPDILKKAKNIRYVIIESGLPVEEAVPV